MNDASQLPLVVGLIVLVVALALVLIATRGSLFALFGKPRALERKTLDVEKKTRELNSVSEALARRRALLRPVVYVGLVGVVVVSGTYLAGQRYVFPSLTEKYSHDSMSSEGLPISETSGGYITVEKPDDDASESRDNDSELTYKAVSNNDLEDAPFFAEQEDDLRETSENVESEKDSGKLRRDGTVSAPAASPLTVPNN
ncbi:MAG: hypothetical protein IJM30_02780 [Thermoguttaceae bacterium]|nr:hypothetical protein [Thermoguttaceae bacterium]